jgi:PAS domain S-box-containing protein
MTGPRDARGSEHSFRGFLEAAPDAVVLADPEGRIVFVNARTEELFGYDREEILGKSVDLLIPERFPERHPSHRAAHRATPRARATGSGLDLLGRRKDGSEFRVEISSNVLETDQGPIVASSIRDVTQRRLADEQRFRLAALVDASDDAIIGKTLDGIITSWNGGAERIFGYSEEEILGQPISRLVPADRQDEERAILEHLARGQIKHFDTVRVRKDGRQIHVSVTSSPIRDSTGGLIGASKVARDITERRRAEDALAQAKDKAEAASRELEAFSYSVAHDLRAPLRAIHGFAHLLMEDTHDRLEAEAQDWLREVALNAQKMAALIDALLSLARISRGEPRRERVDLSSLVRATLREIASEAPDRRVEVIVGEDLWADVDPVLARALLQNLLANAWKFTSKVAAASIEFGATTAADGARAFFVRDNGAGFDMAFAKKLFAPFQRLHASDAFPGTGIGLATVQRVVRRHGGSVWVTAAVDAGATFYFTLPERSSGGASCDE